MTGPAEAVVTRAVRSGWAQGLALFTLGAITKVAELAHVMDGPLLGLDGITPLGPVVILGADAFAATVFGLVVWGVLRSLDRRARSQSVARIAFRCLTPLAGIYLAINYYAFRFLGAPLSPRMSSGVGDPEALVSSVRSFVTPLSLSLVAGLFVLGVGLPTLWGAVVQRRLRRVRGWSLAVVVVAPLWWLAAELLSTYRNTVALETSALTELFNFGSSDGISPVVSPSTRSLHFDLSSLIDSSSSSGDDLSGLAGLAKDSDVLLVVLESTGARYLAPYGADDDVAPRLTALAERSLVFDNFYSLSPASMKALFTVFCSMYPFPAAKAETYVNPRLPCRSLSEQLAAAGYEAALFHSGKFSYSRKDSFFRDRGFSVMRDAANMPASDDVFRNSWGIDERATVEAIVEYVRTRPARQRLFITYVPVFPHHPYDVPEEKFEHYGHSRASFDAYRNAVRFTDTAFGNLLDGLKDVGRLDNTLVVVVADHGEAFGQHRNVRGHAVALYDENIKVPLIIHHASFSSARRVSTIGGLPDLAPTMLDLIGLPPEERYQGISLLRPHPPRFLPMFTDLRYSVLALRDGPWKLIYNVTHDRMEMYRLDEDPQENENLVSRNRDLAARYKQKLRGWAAFQRDLILNYQARAGEGQRSVKRVRYLNQLAPAKIEYDHRSPRRFASTAGSGFRVGGVKLKRGIGMYSNAAMLYELDQRYRNLKGSVARDDRGSRSAATAHIFTNGKEVFSAEVLAGKNPIEFDIDLEGVDQLELRTVDSDRKPGGDHVNWLRMRLR